MHNTWSSLKVYLELLFGKIVFLCTGNVLQHLQDFDSGFCSSHDKVSGVHHHLKRLIDTNSSYRKSAHENVKNVDIPNYFTIANIWCQKFCKYPGVILIDIMKLYALSLVINYLAVCLRLLYNIHCMKSIQIRSVFWSVFSPIRTRKNSVFRILILFTQWFKLLVYCMLLPSL